MSSSQAKVIVGSGWWSTSQEGSRDIGYASTRSPEFFSIWHRKVMECIHPIAIFVTDSCSPRKPRIYDHERIIWIELDRNYGHATDIASGLISTKYCGFTRSVLMSAMYALSCDADYFVYVEQDCLIRGENFLTKAIGGQTFDIYLGERTTGGRGFAGPLAAPMHQQSLMIVTRRGLERFITATLNAAESDGALSPEIKMERDLPPFGILAVPYGRSRPIDFSLSHFYAQHFTKEELQQFLRLEHYLLD